MDDGASQWIDEWRIDTEIVPGAHQLELDVLRIRPPADEEVSDGDLGGRSAPRGQVALVGADSERVDGLAGVLTKRAAAGPEMKKMLLYILRRTNDPPLQTRIRFVLEQLGGP